MSPLSSFNLKDAVSVAMQEDQGSAWKAGIVTGRTLEQNPRYDVRFADGTVELNIAAGRILPRHDNQALDIS